MDFSLDIAGILRKGDVGIWGRLPRVIAGTVVVSACIAGPFAGLASASITLPGSTCFDGPAPCRASVLLARQDDAVSSAKAAEKDSGADGQNEAGADSKTTPLESESGDLERFTPSEGIEADQGVDFPYDI